MNQSARILFPLLLISVFIYSCRKEKYESGRSIPTTVITHRPVANAGKDIFIGPGTCASLRFTWLDGSGSHDPDNNIKSYHWRKIAGPSQGSLSNNGSNSAVYHDIRPGIYSFELTVTDSTGLSSKDTVNIDATAWTLPPHNLDIHITGTFRFEDNFEDCSDFPDCFYDDILTLNGTGTDLQGGHFELGCTEVSDTAQSGNITYSALRLTGQDGNAPYYRFIEGRPSIYLKQLIQNGGGSFTCTYQIFDGSAKTCITDIFENILPLTITGHLDTLSKRFNMHITGTTYF